MFYCEKCREKNGWPEGLSRSRGACEVCGVHPAGGCYDVPSSHLPDNKPAVPAPFTAAEARALTVKAREEAALAKADQLMPGILVKIRAAAKRGDSTLSAPWKSESSDADRVLAERLKALGFQVKYDFDSMNDSFWVEW